MDYIEECGKVPEEEGKDLVRQLLGAVKATHDKGVIHRDIKVSGWVVRG